MKELENKPASDNKDEAEEELQRELRKAQNQLTELQPLQTEQKSYEFQISGNIDACQTTGGITFVVEDENLRRQNTQQQNSTIGFSTFKKYTPAVADQAINIFLLTHTESPEKSKILFEGMLNAYLDFGDDYASVCNRLIEEIQKLDQKIISSSNIDPISLNQVTPHQAAAIVRENDANLFQGKNSETGKIDDHIVDWKEKQEAAVQAKKTLREKIITLIQTSRSVDVIKQEIEKALKHHCNTDQEKKDFLNRLKGKIGKITLLDSYKKLVLDYISEQFRLLFPEDPLLKILPRDENNND